MKKFAPVFVLFVASAVLVLVASCGGSSVAVPTPTPVAESMALRVNDGQREVPANEKLGTLCSDMSGIPNACYSVGYSLIVRFSGYNSVTWEAIRWQNGQAVGSPVTIHRFTSSGEAWRWAFPCALVGQGLFRTSSEKWTFRLISDTGDVQNVATGLILVDGSPYKKLMGTFSPAWDMTCATGG